MKYADKIPFNFILDYLSGIDIVIKPMFGCYGIYAGFKLCLFLMDRDKPLARREAEGMQKGVYVATAADHVDSLKNVFPAAKFEMLKEGKVWMYVPEASAEFEEYVVRACEMIRAGDARIGR
jgi:hypothetical protein